ncbi:uncharacterized protein LOC112349384 [Selaginella moellendorffii]|uniref:uncharacterized protein LOC112349384 n=1 Tax=Selaginella moellendorffii TaxID=88036 RepID=UPI000D1C4DAD|nr:uncharacterized protein LOC112349384 [Selaginella moellendorffii]|eukprot:XP_024539493.1 uncharacterized protein LOC112349384 [Selaginella moellendorffii]
MGRVLRAWRRWHGGKCGLGGGQERRRQGRQEIDAKDHGQRYKDVPSRLALPSDQPNEELLHEIRGVSQVSGKDFGEKRSNFSSSCVRCIQENGEGDSRCEKYRRAYKSLCPIEWVKNPLFPLEPRR